ncbi:MAG: J domain-containing protein [Acidobacteria bacterium]|nr:J domain-containing protein [Acidobacteriota bacterium]
MSAPIAGKFQDHYAVLGIDPRATSETIQETYTKLAAKHHPSSADQPDKEKFDAINLAYEVLSDLALRVEFDRLKGLDPEEGGPKFSGLGFFDSLGRETDLRSALLCVLYDRRRSKPFTPSLSLRQLEGILDAKSDELNFTIWYLKQRNLVLSDDKSALQVTVDGMDFLEKNRPSPDVVMALVRPGAVAMSKAAPRVEALTGIRALASSLAASARSAQAEANREAIPSGGGNPNFVR